MRVFMRGRREIVKDNQKKNEEEEEEKSIGLFDNKSIA